MIRILHTADWHLGHTFTSYDRTHEHLHFLNWLKTTIKEQNIDVLLIAGDVFDVSNPSAQSQRTFYQFIQDITTTHPHLQIVVTAGNHDSPSRLETPIPLFSDKRISVIGLVPRQEGLIDYKRLIIPLLNRNEEVEAFVLAVPFLRQGDYPRVDAANPYAAGVYQFYTDLVTEAENQRNSNQALIAMGHMQTIGSEFVESADRSEKFIIGGLEAVPTTLFAELNYTALGHIHKAQRISGCEHIRYSGSPLPMSFAEKNYKHGVVVVELDQGKTISIERMNYEPLVKMISVPSEGGFATPSEILAELKELPTQIDSDDSTIYPFLEVKVRLEEPEPLLQHRITEVLADKAVRLCRMPSEMRKNSNSYSDEYVSMEGLSTLSPLDIVQKEFSRKYDTDMPDSLIDLFNQVCSEIEIE